MTHAVRIPAPFRPPLRATGGVLLGVGLLTLAFAPADQFYLAWVALVPWLLAVRNAGAPRAFLLGWLGGTLVGAANTWWLGSVSVAGAVACVVYLGLQYGLWAAVVARLRLLEPAGAGRGVLKLLLVAAAWAGCEFLFAVGIPWVVPILCFPWLLLGYTQATTPVLCQVADLGGVFAVGFPLVAVNALLAVAWVGRGAGRSVVPAGGAVLILVAAWVGYGVFRLNQQTTAPGPRAMVVQANHTHLPGGARQVSTEVAGAWNLNTTREALGREAADLVIWSEASVPPLNVEAREQLAGSRAGENLQGLVGAIREIVATHRTAVVCGGFYVGGWTRTGGTREAGDIRNAVYCFTASSPEPARYDKVHLVPFAETLPFRQSAPWLFRVLLRFGATAAEHPLVSGQKLEAMTLSPGGPRFVTPICLENLHGRYVARPFAPGGDGRKGADFIVNVSNDGWFGRTEHAQHLRAISMRSIETRAPAARASNTGISCFIDSNGRIDPATRLPAFTEGTATAVLRLDARVAPYTRIGDAFAAACLAAVPLAFGARYAAGRRSGVSR